MFRRFWTNANGWSTSISAIVPVREVSARPFNQIALFTTGGDQSSGGVRLGLRVYGRQHDHARKRPRPWVACPASPSTAKPLRHCRISTSPILGGTSGRTFRRCRDELAVAPRKANWMPSARDLDGKVLLGPGPGSDPCPRRARSFHRCRSGPFVRAGRNRPGRAAGDQCRQPIPHRAAPCSACAMALGHAVEGPPGNGALAQWRSAQRS